MRETVAGVSGPIALIRFYPLWMDSVGDCKRLYKIPNDDADRQLEAVGRKVAKALGEETAEYLDIQRLFKNSRPEAKWIEIWRTNAIIDLAEVGGLGK